MNNYEKLCNVLKTNPALVTENGDLLKNKVQELARKMDASLLATLLSDTFTEEMFFVDVDGMKVFDANKFTYMVESHAFLPDSYTRFKQNIMLTDGSHSIRKSNDIVLEFPHKDCVLCGGQTKEEKRQEVMLNETLMRGEIDVLLDHKALVNAKKYDQNGVIDIENYNDENLIIKGNNLIALHSLYPKFRGRIKLIYIDVPFNTGNDSFMYNDTFTRSTWLTFMKNRIEIARKLLCEDGSFFIHCDYNQGHYLKVLLDEILGEDNFMNEIIWRYRTYVGQVKDFFPRKHDTIFWYKNDKRPEFKKSNVGNFEDTPDYERWKNFLTKDGKILYGNHPTTDSRFTAYLNKYIKQFGQPNVGDVIYENRGYIVDDVWEDIIALDAKNKSERLEAFSGSGQKPEALIERIIDSVTKEGDIVLDFFMGSGTTMATAHKMNRRYIGIEQMDYIEDISVKRLQSVINGDKGGISQKINWTGGGSFVFFELAKNSQNVLDRITATNDADELSAIYDELKSSPFVLYTVDIFKMEKEKDAFAALTIDEQKKFLVSIIDKNTLYVNYSDIENDNHSLSDADKAFTKNFYKED